MLFNQELLSIICLTRWMAHTAHFKVAMTPKTTALILIRIFLEAMTVGPTQQHNV